MSPNTSIQRDNETFRRLRSAYLIALGLIALAVLAEQWLVGSFLADQRNDAEIINVAGRQRMLSQRIVKQLAFQKPEINDLMERWQTSHTWLKEQLKNTDMASRLHALDPIVKDYLAGEVTYTDSLSEHFLLEMDAIVNDISATAAEKVVRLQRTKRLLGGITLGVLLLELLFIFLPITRFISEKIQSLREERAAQEAARLAAEEAVYQREKSLRELQALNEAIDEAVLFATLRRDGFPVYLSRQFSKIIGPRGMGQHLPLPRLLHPSPSQQAYFKEAIAAARAGSWTGEWEIQDEQGQSSWLNVTIVPARRTDDEAELFLLAHDITTHKANQAALEKMSRERLEEQVQLSKQRARHVVNAQEKERLRIARDLHDGIGQKLTALKMGLESLRTDAMEQQQEKVFALRALAKEIILSVRVATFNLSPPELSDYGLAVGLDKLCRELSQLTGQRIVLEKNNFSARFDSVREISIFRIVQEAINNAIKYARADYVLVAISTGERIFSVTISDNGDGFNPDNLSGNGGHGLNNMTSRVEDMNGRLFIHSDPDTGTKVTINLPMHPKS